MRGYFNLTGAVGGGLASWSRVPAQLGLVRDASCCSYNESNCYDRSLTPLGSSTQWPPSRDGGPLESDDCSENPTFCSFNFAIIPYCDGFSQLGSRSDPIVFSNATFSANLWARGYDNLGAALDYLVAHTSLARAPQVLLDGCSAGGLSTLHHTDRVAAALPPTTRVASVADAGFFVDAPIVVGDAANYTQGEFYYRSLLTYYFPMHNGTAGVKSACLASRPPELAWECALAQVTVAFNDRPVFAVQSQYDSYQMGNTFAPPWLPAVDPSWPACTANVSLCSAAQINALETQWAPEFRGALAVAGLLGPTALENGLFLHNCYTHCQSGDYHGLVINGTSAYDAMTALFAAVVLQGEAGDHYQWQWVDTPMPSSNPSCVTL